MRVGGKIYLGVDSTLCCPTTIPQGDNALAIATPTPIFYCSCHAKNNLEHATKSTDKQEQVDKQTLHKPCPRDKSETREFEVLDTSNRMV
jgi:hypothetical protein